MSCLKAGAFYTVNFGTTAPEFLIFLVNLSASFCCFSLYDQKIVNLMVCLLYHPEGYPLRVGILHTAVIKN